jgi:hypothetical protein
MSSAKGPPGPAVRASGFARRLGVVQVSADDAAPPSPRSDERLGGIAVQLALKFPEWIERRVEHVSYLDRDTTRKAQGVMFRWRLPHFFLAGATPQQDELVYVPLDLLTKAPLTGLQGMRPDGSPFPILPFRRSTALASAGITTVVWGRSVATREGRGLEDDNSLRILDAIVSSPPEIARPLLRVLDDPHSELGEILATHSEIRGLLEELAENFMLLAPAEVEKPSPLSLLRPAAAQSSTFTPDAQPSLRSRAARRASRTQGRRSCRKSPRMQPRPRHSRLLMTQNPPIRGDRTKATLKSCCKLTRSARSVRPRWSRFSQRSCSGPL